MASSGASFSSFAVSAVCAASPFRTFLLGTKPTLTFCFQGGCPVSRMKSTTPMDQRSACVLYFRENTSGATYSKVPTMVRFSAEVAGQQSPKSTSTSSESGCLVRKRRFSGFTSRWIRPTSHTECMCARAESEFCMMNFACSSVRAVPFTLRCSNKSGPSRSSITTKKFASLMIVSSSRTTLGCEDSLDIRSSNETVSRSTKFLW
mmetsp:Transcript_29359/g.69278  ORF Transcript_29359/g.69278 Transcript_29359/m.69278 type:complete len:205 (-) Transcript_29359:919-1533(-)